MNWKDELKEQAGMPVAINDHGCIHIDNVIPFVESLLKKEYDKGYRDGHRNTTIKYFVEGGSE